MSVASPPGFLPSPETLRAASRLERHVEWHKGFWLAYVFTRSPPQAHMLQERVGGKLRAQGRGQRILEPRTPEALEDIIEAVLADPQTGCTWVEAVRGGAAIPNATLWANAWTRLILRANERRELLRGAMGGGLVFVAHADLKAKIRDAGPDLWSIRSFVLELPPGRDEREPAIITRSAQEHGDARVDKSFVELDLLDADLRRLPEALDGQDDAARAGILARTATQLRLANRFDEAATMWQQVVGLHRSLARDHGNLPKLAGALNQLGICLSEAGRREEALEAIREAVDIDRRLADQQPDAFRSALASSLNNLGNSLSSMGRRDEALAAALEAVDIHRDLAARRPEAFLSDLAMSLNNLGIRLSDVGRPEEALRATQEAISLYAGLEEPSAYDPGPVRALNNLGLRLGALGQHQDALRVTQMAVDAYRGLAEQRPLVFDADLAMSLNNLGMMQSKIGDAEAALRSTAEAVAIHRQLAQRWPDAFLPELAMSLNNLRALLRSIPAGRSSLPVELRPWIDRVLEE